LLIFSWNMPAAPRTEPPPSEPSRASRTSAFSAGGVSSVAEARPALRRVFRFESDAITFCFWFFWSI